MPCCGEYRTEFIQAIYDNDRNKIDEIIASGEAFNFQDSDGNYPLHIAASLGRNAIVRKLLRVEVDVNALNNNQESSLFLAIENNQAAVAKLLVRRGVEITEKEVEILNSKSAMSGKKTREQKSLGELKDLIEEKKLLEVEEASPEESTNGSYYEYYYSSTATSAAAAASVVTEDEVSYEYTYYS